MKIQLFCFTVFLLICLLMPAIAPAQVVDIPDPNLRTAIENFRHKAPGAEITVDDMARLAFFNAGDMGIRDLTGLEHAANLTSLGLDHNSIVDISPLADLTQLQALVLDYNLVADISPLAGLTQLDLLWLRSNLIADISPLAGLTQLKLLWLEENLIADISPLAGLTQLSDLQLVGNSIADLSPLVANTGLGNGDTVDVKINPLSDASIHTYIPVLQSRGVRVTFDEPAPTPVVNPEPADANRDGVVNVLDLVLVSQYFGQAHRQADINGDGIVNILDLVFVAQHFGSTVGDIDIDSPMIVKGTVEDGSPFVDPVPINVSGLQFEFNEAVSGSLKLTDEAGVDLNWLGTVAGRTATLTPVAGQEMDYETIYKVEIDVMDGVGNSSLITITFVTIPREEID